MKMYGQRRRDHFRPHGAIVLISLVIFASFTTLPPNIISDDDDGNDALSVRFESAGPTIFNKRLSGFFQNFDALVGQPLIISGLRSENFLLLLLIFSVFISLSFLAFRSRAPPLAVF